MTSVVRSTAVAAFSILALSACSPKEPVSSGGPPEIRRLTEAQYRQTIADIFGDDIKVAGRFEPGMRASGLLAVGTAKITITPAGFEQYDSMAHGIARQVVDDKHRSRLVGCKPAAANAPDEACTTAFLRRVGFRLFRRPLTEEELKGEVAVADSAAQALGDFYAGLEYGLAGLLAAPEFLFRDEQTEPDPDHPGRKRLTAYSMAARLSFLLWDTTPDAELLDAATRGDLYDRTLLARQVDRMLASPRLEQGARAFFSDMLGFDSFESLAKDSVIYPKFSLKVANDAREQTLRTLVDELIVHKGDYRDIFTSRKTFLTRNLGMLYKVPVATRNGWEPHVFDPGDERAGMLSEISFLALHSHPGRSSATLRGKAIRELLLCEQVPMPPPNVNFSIVQDTNNPRFKTARERLTAHRTNPTCAGCHKMIDPIGLGLENFDGAGQFRASENGARIDASGEIDGIAFKDAAGLGRAMHDDPAAVSCVVADAFRYGTGREIAPGEKEYMAWLKDRFAAAGYEFPALLRTIALSDGFYKVSEPAGSGAVREAER